ncbi:methionine--tRNA ligase [Patescibacteria group bacterium]|nr:methionine--tRNA ligase [Patescibacteria group bacterium]MBU0963907.1 methionine--tRNA ligase [Patescibacteria group bacterium]
MSKKFYITTPIYYVNDKPHIGHLYTTIAADVLARYYRQNDYEVFFLTGTDEHGAKVAESAKESGLEPKAFTDQNSQLFRDIFKKLDISLDYFIRTTDARHEESVKKFIQKLYDQGDIYEGKYEGLYCVGCEKFITKKELVNGHCPDHKKPPENLTEKNYFFKLKKYLPEVERLIIKDKILIRPDSRKSEVLGFFKQGLDDFSVSREKVEWGIPLPFDAKQKTYVWVEALQNYISAIGYGDNEKDFKKWWPADVHLMARDIIKFHCIYWPALLIASGLEVPKQVYSHGFFTVNNQKMSKSIGNVIDPYTMVEQFGVDATRYLLLSQFPFSQDGDIKASLFKEKYNADLANNLGNLLSRVFNMLEKYCDGKIPQQVASPIYLAPVRELIENLKFNEALREMWQAIDKANKIIDENKPWQMAKDASNRKKLDEILSQLASFLLELVVYIRPFMPSTAATIVGSLESEKITKGEPLFMRI